MILSALLVFNLPACAQVQDAETPYQPSTEWEIGLTEASCELVQEFGDGDDKLIFKIVQGVNFHKADLLLSADWLAKLSGSGLIHAKLQSADKRVALNVTSRNSPDKGQSFWRLHRMEINVLDNAAPTDILTIRENNNSTVSLQLEDMPEALERLKSCQRQLSQKFGVGLEAATRISALPQPRGNPANWTRPDDYSPDEFEKLRKGKTVFRVQVGPNGRATDCTILASSGSAELDEKVCLNLKRRSRFRPATDNSGNPIAGHWTSDSHWQIPRE